MKKRKIIIGSLVLASLMGYAISASAEGSKELNADSVGKYRMYLEWYPNKTTAGIERKNVLSVYAEDGETIYLGTSGFESLDNKDIALFAPDGTETDFDALDYNVNIANANKHSDSEGIGTIRTRVMEVAGPNIDGSNPNGYKPFEYKVETTGIYQVIFYSKLPNSISNSKMPTVVNDVDLSTITDENRVYFDDTIRTGGYASFGVACWDISVYGTDNKEKTGRVFSKYFSLTDANKDLSYSGGFYVLTRDGYEYKVTLPNIDPQGFIITSNNRGLLDEDKPIYKNAYSNPTIAVGDATQMTDMIGNIKIPNPNEVETEKDYSHYLFVNKPSDDLPQDTMPTSPLADATAESFEFDGTSKGKTTVGKGGSFLIDFNRATNYQLIIDTNQDGNFDSEDVVIADSATKGKNTIKWDGKDNSGNDVAIGEYKVKITTRGGEYHFPMLDVENNTGGVISELINDSRVSGDDVYKVYFDATDYVAANGEEVAMNASKYLTPSSALDGISSKDGIYKFQSNFGDTKALDYWTYTLGNSVDTTLNIAETDIRSTVTGKVFNDTNGNGKWDTDENGYPDISVAIKDCDGNTTNVKTDANGEYTAEIPMGDYEIIITTPNGKKVTTGSVDNTGITTEETVNATVADLGLTTSTTTPSYHQPYALANNYAYIFGYNDKEMAAENPMKLGESCAVLYRLLKQNNKTTDFVYDANNAPAYPEFLGRWDRSAAEYMISKGILPADDTSMNLEGYIQRRLAFKIIAISLGFTDDINLSDEEYASILMGYGAVEGDDNSDLKLYDAIKRDEFCKIYNIIIGRSDAKLVTEDEQQITYETYGFEDLADKTDKWYYEIMLRATSAYDKDGFVNIELRGKRNVLDDYSK